MMPGIDQRYAGVALASALLFGVGTPLAKALLGALDPVLLAGLLYAGSGLGLALVALLRRKAKAAPPLERRHLPWLAGAVASGGVAAPLLLLWGLSRIPASEASLLLNLEAVITVLVASVIFGEHVSARVWAATAIMLSAGLLLAWTPGESFPLSAGALAIVGACLFWALDNNLTRPISAADPVKIALVKGLAAGLFNIAVAALTGSAAPRGVVVAEALVLGAFSYGASLVLYIIALRHLGSARTGAHFASAPFIGAAVALIALDEKAGPAFWWTLALMMAATALLITERHTHRHTHESLRHEHTHVHDEHHRHSHTRGDDEPHSHWHVHEPLTHWHPHLPDLHHRHRH